MPIGVGLVKFMAKLKKKIMGKGAGAAPPPPVGAGLPSESSDDALRTSWYLRHYKNTTAAYASSTDTLLHLSFRTQPASAGGHTLAKTFPFSKAYGTGP